MSVSTRFSTDRIQALSDGIFAIAMTLLVLTLDVPELAAPADQDALAAALLGLGSRFWAVVLSFLLLGSFWRVHHRQYRHIQFSTDGLVWINLLSLLFVVLLPFSTELIGEYGDLPLACIVFAANMLVIGLLVLAQWLYAVRKGLLQPDLPASTIRLGVLRNLVVPVLSVVAMALAPFIAANGTWAYLAVFPAMIYLRGRTPVEGGQD